MTRRAVVVLVLSFSVLFGQLSVAGAAPPANDDIGSAVEVSVPFATEQDTREATRALDDPVTEGRDCFGEETHSVWFRFVPPDPGTYVLDSAGSDYDTTIAIYTGSPGALSLVECSGYFGGTSNGRILLEATQATTYYVMVAATESSPDAGRLSLIVDRSPVAPLEVAFSLDPQPGLLDNGEIELSGEVTCSRPARLGFDGAVNQGATTSYFFPPETSCGPEGKRFRAPTRERQGEEFVPGPANVLLIAYGFDEYDRDVPEVDVEVQVGAGRVVYARSTGPRDSLSRTELFVMDPDGSNVLQLTENEVEDNFAALSPDGRYIAFSRGKRRGFDLFIMRSNGRNVTRLTDSSRDEVFPSWSPDGNFLVYSSTINTEAGWQSDLFKMRLYDRKSRRLTDTARAREFGPEWSPDGSKIAFTRQVLSVSRSGIGTIDLDGGNLRWLVRNPRDGGGYTDYAPTWSPDSQWIAFSREHGVDAGVDVFRVRRDGTGLTPVTELSDLSQFPTWGTDDRIAFQFRGGIGVVRPCGGDVEIIGDADTRRPYHWPDW